MIITTRTLGDENLAAPAPPSRPLTGTAASTALMNRIYRRQRHIYDLTRRFFLLGRNRLIADLAPEPGHAVLEIGCGTGRNLILAARRYPQAQFFGIDVSTHMLTSAIEAIERAGLESHVRVAHADATAFHPRLVFGQPRFDRIMISYSLSMIPGWHGVLDVALSLLAKGGRLAIVDFGGQERLPATFRALLRAWLALFHVKPADSLEAELASRAARAGAKLTVERPCRGYVVYAVVEAKK